MVRLTYLLLSVLFLCQCTKKTLEYDLQLEDTIRINLQTEPPTLDWIKSHDNTSSTVIKNLMDGLVTFDYKSPELKAIPSLASEWKVSTDAKRWTFIIRQGVKWTDGVDFTAQQVVDGWERLLTAKTGAPYANILYNIKNAKAFFDGKVKSFSEVGVKIDENGNIVVELEKPMSFFPMILTQHAAFPIRKDLIAKYGEDHWTDPDHIQTLGPYKLKIWDHDKAIVLTRNDSYWGEKAKTKNILGYMINEYSTAISLFNAGKTDFQEQIPFNQVASLKGTPGFARVQTLGIYYYGFNTKKPPFNNVKVRHAIVSAIDRKQITDLLAAGMEPLPGWIPPGMFGHEPDVGTKFDPEKAAQLLDEAGYKDRSKFPKFTIGFNTDENHQRVAENVQAQLKKNLGLQAEIANEEWKVYLSHMIADAHNLFRIGWIADYPDPETFFAIMTSDSENNHTGWKNKEYDKLIEMGSSELNPEKRRDVYRKAQKILVEDEAAVFPIYVQVYNRLVSPRLKNFPDNRIERLELKWTSIQP